MRNTRTFWVLAGALLIAMGPTSVATADDAKALVQRHIEAHRALYGELAQQIWELSEVGYQEVESSASGTLR